MLKLIFYSLNKMIWILGNLYVLFLGILLFYYLASITNFVQDNKKDKKKDIPFLYDIKYNKKYNELKNTEIDYDKKKGLSNCVLYENTPSGNIIIYYDAEKEGFVYYSDNALPYRYLESVAKRYVITFNCKNIYIDMNNELQEVSNKIKASKEKEREKQKEREENEKMQKEENNMTPVDNKPSKNVFAKFKKYNKKAGNTGQPVSNSNDETLQNEDNTLVIKEKINRYHYEGKIRNYNILEKEPMKRENPIEKLSFADFKRLSQKK